MADPQHQLEVSIALPAPTTLWDLIRQTKAKTINRIPANSVNNIEICYVNKLPIPGLNQLCAMHWYSFAFPSKSKDKTPFAQQVAFKQLCLSDSGCSCTVIAEKVLKKHCINFDKNVLGERLPTAGSHDLQVNGIITLEGGFKNKHGITKTTYMHCLVSDSIKDEIIISSFIAEAVSSCTIAKDSDCNSELYSATSRCATVLNPLSKEEIEKVKHKSTKITQIFLVTPSMTSQ